MKICFDYEIFWKQKFSGIASRYFYNLIKHLAQKEGLNLKVFANFYFNEKIKQLSPEIVKGSRLNFRVPFTGKILEKINSILCRNQIIKFNPNVIHKTYYSNQFKKNTSRIILTVFDLWHEKNTDFKYMPKSHSLNISDHIVCPSQKTKDDLIDIYNVDKNKITVTYFGIEKFDEFFQSNNYDEFKDPFILYVGARGRYKNFTNFIKAYVNSKRLKNDFKVVCFGGENFNKNELDFFKKNKINELIIRPKANDDFTLLNLYKNAKCLVYPSSHEGLGLPPLEAMSLGCPVISSNHEGIIEGVGEAAETFDPYSIDDIRYKIEKILYSEKNINDLVFKGNKQSQKFSWEKCTEETLKVYTQS